MSCCGVEKEYCFPRCGPTICYLIENGVVVEIFTDNYFVRHRKRQLELLNPTRLYTIKCEVDMLTLMNGKSVEE